MNPDQERAFNFVVSLRDFYGDYHAKKEREAYAVAVLYLGATAAVLRLDWSGRTFLLIIAGVIGATVLTVALVAFQLHSRRVAARIVGACTTVASRWLGEPPPLEQYRAAELGDAHWPRAVVDEFRKQPGSPALAALLVVPPVVALWGVALVCTLVVERAPPMNVVLWLNLVGLSLGLVGAIILGFFPPTVQDYNPDGSPANRLLLESQPTRWGRFRVRWDPWMRLAGPFLLALAFVLQLLALLTAEVK